MLMRAFTLHRALSLGGQRQGMVFPMRCKAASLCVWTDDPCPPFTTVNTCSIPKHVRQARPWTIKPQSLHSAGFRACDCCARAAAGQRIVQRTSELPVFFGPWHGRRSPACDPHVSGSDCIRGSPATAVSAPDASDRPSDTVSACVCGAAAAAARATASGVLMEGFCGMYRQA